MSAFRDVVARMAVDAEFARHARAHPEEVARSYGLTAAEAGKLRGLADAGSGAGPMALGARLSKSGLGTGGLAGLMSSGGDGLPDIDPQDSAELPAGPGFTPDPPPPELGSVLIPLDPPDDDPVIKFPPGALPPDPFQDDHGSTLESVEDVPARPPGGEQASGAPGDPRPEPVQPPDPIAPAGQALPPDPVAPPDPVTPPDPVAPPDPAALAAAVPSLAGAAPPLEDGFGQDDIAIAAAGLAAGAVAGGVGGAVAANSLAADTKTEKE